MTDTPLSFWKDLSSFLEATLNSIDEVPFLPRQQRAVTSST